MIQSSWDADSVHLYLYDLVKAYERFLSTFCDSKYGNVKYRDVWNSAAAFNLSFAPIHSKKSKKGQKQKQGKEEQKQGKEEQKQEQKVLTQSGRTKKEKNT